MRLGDYLFLKLYTANGGVTYVSKKPHVRTLMDSQHVKRSKTLHKFARQYPFQFFFIKISEKSSLVVYEILRLFVNILTVDERYSLSVKASV